MHELQFKQAVQACPLRDISQDILPPLRRRVVKKSKHQASRRESCRRRRRRRQVVSWCHRRRGRRGRRRVVGRCLVVLHAPEIAGRAGGLRVRHQHPETHGQQVQKTA